MIFLMFSKNMLKIAIVSERYAVNVPLLRMRSLVRPSVCLSVCDTFERILAESIYNTVMSGLSASVI